MVSGGFGSAVLEFAANHHYKNDVMVKGIPDEFIEHGPINTLFETLELDTGSLKRFINSKF